MGIEYDFRAGDILGFNGQGWVSGLINIGTFAFPGLGLSHVAIVASLHGEKVFFESTSVLPDEPQNACIVTGECIKGVQCHRLSHISTRPGKVWVYRLKEPLLPLESAQLTKFLLKQIGKPYDMIGAASAGGGKLRSCIRQRIYQHDLSTVYCSELCGDAINIFEHGAVDNPSATSPNCLMRYVVSDGIYNSAELLRFQKAS